jgi:hypothetical protein
MFMVDMSGSTKGWVNDAERESLVLLCEAIEALGDSYAIYGFSGWTRTHCDIYRIKRFGDRYDAATRRRIAGIEARDYTRMGVAVRHLSGLLQRPERPPQAAGDACPTAAPTTTATSTAAAMASRTPAAPCSKRARRASAATASPSTATAPTTCRSSTARRITR